MKIRNGFVSNSSSSSFVVVFPREPKSMEEVKDLLFDKDQTIYANPYYDPEYYNIEDSGWDINTVATTVWNDICEQSKNDFEKAIEEMGNGVIDDNDAPDYDDFKNINDWEKRWKEYRKACRKYGNKKLNDILNIRKTKLKKINGEIPNFAMYIFEYSDQDGSYGCSLEHGDLFRKLKHIKISKH
jgi:hypothetical protein